MSPYRIDGRVLTDDDLLRMVEDQPCLLCQAVPPAGVVVREPDEWATPALWVRFGPGRLQRAHTKAIAVYGLCVPCVQAFGLDLLPNILDALAEG